MNYKHKVRLTKDIKDFNKLLPKLGNEVFVKYNFSVNEDFTEMYVYVADTCYVIDNYISDKYFANLTIEEHHKRKCGPKVTSYYNLNGYMGFNISDSKDFKQYNRNDIYTDSHPQGTYYVIKYEVVFSLVMRNGMEHFGDSLLNICFADSYGRMIEDAQIGYGEDDNCYRTHKFYVKKIQTLNDYELIIDLYNKSFDQYKYAIIDEDGMYKQAIEYYENRGMFETVRVLTDIHNSVIK
jgi:hypothetical protein